MRIRSAHALSLCLLLSLSLAAAAADAKRAPTWTWRSLHRSLHLPVVTKGARCPVSPMRPVRLAAGDVVDLPGPGPAYPVLYPGTLLPYFWPVRPSSEWYGSGWSGNKVMWIVAARYRGPVLVRGRQLDGAHLVRFNRGRPPQAELRLVGSTGAGPVRRYPSSSRVQAEGCYAYQIDGLTFSRVIVFEARVVVQPP